MRKRSLVTQLRMTLVYIIFGTILTTLLTYAVVVILFLNALYKNQLYPENHYEQQIPAVKRLVLDRKSGILSPVNKEFLDKMIQGDGFFYQVTDREGHILYGTYGDQIFESGEKLCLSLNTTFLINDYYAHVTPVMGDSGTIEGAFTFIYTLSLSDVNSNKWIGLVLILVILAPFLYMILFTILFTRLYAGNISSALRILTDASRQIRNKNLDFTIEYRGDNELGELCTAFTDMKEELKHSLSTQWKLEQERVEMVEALAHDLKSPLSVIKAYTEALADDTGVDEEQKQYLMIMEENIEKSISLVRQMQYTSDLDHAGIVLEKTPFDLAAFLARKTAEYELRSKVSQISITLAVENEIPVPVVTDSNILERILDNIVSNSLQYTSSGGKITISVMWKNDKIFYRICDTGPGFRGKDLDKALDKFYRGDEARQSKGGHSGLGLYIAKQLVELLGGFITLENAKQGGACVIFCHGVKG